MATDFDRQQRRVMRDERRYERLGSDPRCCLCPDDDVRALDRHHIAGEANADTTVIVCASCHRKLSDGQYDWPDGLLQGGGGSAVDRVKAHLHGLADLAQEFGATHARLLREVAAMIDAPGAEGG
jgi:hypothetical protein